jgi:hypothetical protein
VRFLVYVSSNKHSSKSNSKMLSFARVLAFLAVVVAVFFAENSPSVLAAGGLRNINLGPDAKPSPDAKAAAKKQDGVEEKI